MVLRNLKEQSWYKVQIQAMNMLGESKPCIAYFVTRSEPSDWFKYEGQLFTRPPVKDFYKSLPKCAHRVFLVILVAFYAVVIIYLALWSYDKMVDRQTEMMNRQSDVGGSQVSGESCRCFADEFSAATSGAQIPDNSEEDTGKSTWFGA